MPRDVESRRGKAVDGMTLLTGPVARARSKRPIVKVAVAVDTGGELDRLSCRTLTVTLLARHRSMLSSERKLCFVMVESGRFNIMPSVRRVTAGAVGPETAFVCVDMAVGTLRESDRFEPAKFGILGIFRVL